jgi:hypothetical protein
MRVTLRHSWNRLCGVVALGLVVKIVAGVLAPGGPVAYAIELGLDAILLALLGIAWAAGNDGPAAFTRPGRAGYRRRLPSPAKPGAVTLCCAGMFCLLTLAIRTPGIQNLDTRWVASAHLCGGPEVTVVLRRISGAGGRDLLVYGVPLLMLLLALRRRARPWPYSEQLSQRPAVAAPHALDPDSGLAGALGAAATHDPGF